MKQHPSITIKGGQRLSGGQVSIAGSSNQVTKCIIASLLTAEPVLLKGVPDVDERYIVEELYRHLGGSVEQRDNGSVLLDPSGLHTSSISAEICRKNRISILAAGPLLHKFGEFRFFGRLGGDQIGKRPVDFHLQGLQQMGANVEFDSSTAEYRLSVNEGGLHGAHIRMPFPSVMATENLIITASLAKGRTVIENAAVEPEIVELCKMLQKMGADIMVSADRTYIIEGVEKLRGCELRIMPDRNQAVSFAVAALATGGDVLIRKMPHDPVFSFINFIQRMGAEFKVSTEGVYVKAPKSGILKATHIEVDVHPGFMTDWQQPFMVLFTQSHGVSVLHETVFDDRLGYTSLLNKMGAKIQLSNKCLGELPCRFKNRNHSHSAIIQGPTPLHAHDFELPSDIRAGMCLVVAGLVAHGSSTLTRITELERKYDNLVPKLQEMGADIWYGEKDAKDHSRSVIAVEKSTIPNSAEAPEPIPSWEKDNTSELLS
jgi:UDP-N-acetylglucosamine 1-carboxyvinyltransferase